MCFIISFYNLLDENLKTIEYNKTYKDFSEFLSQKKMIFNTEICSRDVEDKKLIYNAITA